ncbi:MAG: hypothetical protein J7K62_01940 [Thermoplasmata archaeon]|nr:hypothetical protein [Thermoplasmata archaeon]
MKGKIYKTKKGNYIFCFVDEFGENRYIHVAKKDLAIWKKVMKDKGYEMEMEEV